MRLQFFLIIFCLMLSTAVNAADAFSINLFKDKTDRQFIDNTIQAFMQQYQIPGLSIALAKDEEILLAKAYGYADLENKIPVNITHKFRLASISKPITAVAIILLREQGKLSLEDKVFGPNGILKNEFPVTDKLMEKITVRHLLEHTAAKEWTNDNHDPMFQKTSLSQAALIRWALKNKSLTKIPGTEYAYSNFGYCLLGRIIEKLSGVRYQYYVKKNIFSPIAAKSFAIGSKKMANVLFEVRYYPDTEESPYWFPLARMDAHGGWVANATDVLKFSMSVDGRGDDILSKESIALMTTPSKRNQHYALGWNVNQYNNWWHVGNLPGTATIIVRTAHGYNWVVLLNKRNQDENFMTELDNMPWKLIQGIKALNK